MKRIGIFGGTFNPVHQGHLIIAEQSRTRLDLDFVLFVPAKNPYHKNKTNTSFQHRSNMLELAIKDNEYFLVDYSEDTIKGNSYSFNTVQSIINYYGNENQYFFIMGEDSLINIETWYRYKDLLNLVDLVVVKRQGEDMKLENMIKKISSFTKISLIEDLNLKISSTFIRESVNKNKSIKYLLPDNVIFYIVKNKLYGD